MKAGLALVLSFAVLSAGAAARGSGHGGHHGSGTSHTQSHASPSRTVSHTTRESPGSHAVTPHDSHAPGATGRHHNYASSQTLIHHYHRSFEAKKHFWVMTGHPHGWPGHVVDHVVPLACGGPDSPSNMQWQTVAEAKAKDKTERAGCHDGHR